MVNPAPRRNRRGQFVKSGRRSNPANPKRRRRSNPVAALAGAANPKRRRYRNNPANPARRRKYRRNPISLRDPLRAMVPALWGGAGAVAVGAAVANLPLPVAMKTGRAAYLTRAALAVALGILGRPLLGERATLMGNGALIVVAYDAIRDFSRSAGLNLGAYDPVTIDLSQYDPALLPAPDAAEVSGLGAYDGATVEDYVS